MPPIIHCVRHAQGFHNLTPANHVMPDPLLTPHGKTQCTNLLVNFPFHSDVELIVASPLRRTIYTAMLAFAKPIRDRGLKIIALPEIQETSEVPCDVGSDLAELEKEVKENNLPVDLSLVSEDWNDKTLLKWSPSVTSIADRARAARQWLKARPEKTIVMVSHGGYLHYFTEDWQDSTLYQGTGWANTEFRTFEFRDSTNDEDIYGMQHGEDTASIVELLESRKRRGKAGKAPSREQQKQFCMQALSGWKNQLAQNAHREPTQEKEAAEMKAEEEVVIPEEREVKTLAS